LFTKGVVMKSKPEVGMVVRLNDEGMKAIGGLTSWAMVKQAATMQITHVEWEEQAEQGECFPIKVSAPLLNQFGLDHTKVDPIL
jgi:hypothetical protein